MTILSESFGDINALLRSNAEARASSPALIQGDRRVTWAELDRSVDRIGAGLQAQGVAPGDRVAICAVNSIDYALAMLGALRARAVPALVPPSVTPEARAAMIADSGARIVLDESNIARPPSNEGSPVAHPVRPDDPFN